jgi:hypothetical protein
MIAEWQNQKKKGRKILYFFFPDFFFATKIPRLAFDEGASQGLL